MTSQPKCIPEKGYDEAVAGGGQRTPAHAAFQLNEFLFVYFTRPKVGPRAVGGGQVRAYVVKRACFSHPELLSQLTPQRLLGRCAHCNSVAMFTCRLFRLDDSSCKPQHAIPSHDH